MRAGVNRQGRPAKTGEWSDLLELRLQEEEEEEEEEDEDEQEQEEGGGGEGEGMPAAELNVKVGAVRPDARI